MEKRVSTTRLIVVSRDSEVLRLVWTVAKSNSWQFVTSSDAWDAMEKLQSDMGSDILLVDLSAGDTERFRCLRWLRRLRPRLPILLIDRTQKTDTTLHSIRVGSDDFLVAPLAAPQLGAVIQRSHIWTCDDAEMEIASNSSELSKNGLLFIGASPKLYRISAQVVLLAAADLPVFISGERGSGKEVIALLLHRLSARSGSAFTRVDCAILPTALLEREIFDGDTHPGARIAGTANEKRESCGGGTLFLDHIEEMPSQLQLKLASVIESGRLTRPGMSEPVKMDVRVVAASSLSIDRAISENRIIPELLRQFDSREIRVPPLRERKEELPLLVCHYMHQLSRQFGLSPKEFSVETEKVWQSYPWPGNLRELRQVVKRYMIAGEATPERKTIAMDQTRQAVQTETPGTNPSALRLATDVAKYKSLRSILRSVKEEAERAAISAALEETGWNRKAAARLLKVSYRSILYKIDEYQMNLPDRRTSSARHEISAGKQGELRGDHNGSVCVILGGEAQGTS